MKMKLLITGLALMALTTLASAQNKEVSSPNAKAGTEKGVNFVDANNDGVCDNLGTNSGNGANCKGRGCGMGRGQMRGNGNCSGMGKGMGKGNGKNFVDADKNGICDNFETAAKK